MGKSVPFLCVVACAAFSACGFPRPADVGDDTGDAGASGLDASPADGTCFGSFFLKICLEVAPNAPLTISTSAMIDTDSPLCATTVSGGANYCVIAATSITINAKMRATGTRPLVLIASKSILTTDMIDVGSHRGATPEGIGAGADSGLCMAGAGPAITTNAGSGGGAGGSFIGLGGYGGLGGNGGGGGTPGAAVTDVAVLRGGCRGQAGRVGLDSGATGAVLCS